MKKKFGIVGCGFLGNIVADAWKNGLLPDYELVGVASRTRASAEKTAANVGCAVCDDVDALLALQPEYIVETASVEAVRAMGRPGAEKGRGPCHHLHRWPLPTSIFTSRSRPLPWKAGQRCIWPAVPSAALMCCRPSP